MNIFERHTNSVDMAMAIHEMSMSKDPQEACAGRLYKAVFPVFESALQAELCRPQLSTGDVVNASIDLLTSVLASMGLTLTHPGYEAKLVLDLADLVSAKALAAVNAATFRDAVKKRA